MKMLAVNGSPRKKWNTARLLEAATEGAASCGADARVVHLYDLEYKGCVSCFACKVKGGKSYGRCVVADGLQPLLDEIDADVDALVLGTPIYFFDATGEARSFMERLLFQYLLYTNPLSCLLKRRIRAGLVCTMNIPEEAVAATGLDRVIEQMRGCMEFAFGNCDLFLATDTLQFANPDLYDTGHFDTAAKQRRHDEIFSAELARARDFGRNLAEG